MAFFASAVNGRILSPSQNGESGAILSGAGMMLALGVGRDLTSARLALLGLDYDFNSRV